MTACVYANLSETPFQKAFAQITVNEAYVLYAPIMMHIMGIYFYVLYLCAFACAQH